MALIIHAFPPSPRSFKVLLAAQHLGIDYQLRFVNLPARGSNARQRRCG